VRGFIATVLVLIAATCVIFLISPPKWTDWHFPARRHAPRPVEAPSASLPEGRLTLVLIGEEDAIFLAPDETRTGEDRLRFTSLIVTPGARGERPAFTVIHETADCRRRKAVDATYADYDPWGRPMTHSEASPAEGRPASFDRLLATDAARVAAACGETPKGPKAEVTGWQTALAAAPSLIAAGRAMAARQR
jgi:hypothetical protein